MLRAAIIGLGLISALSGCTPDIQDMGLTRTAPSQMVRDCASAGGTLATTGKHGKLVCVNPADNAGKR